MNERLPECTAAFDSGRFEATWFGQPRGLTVLFLTNMWEFFSYYGMRTLLVYYMTKQLLFAQEKSSFIYGFYTAAAYFTPILGGAIADRWLGKRRAVIIGGSIMALGHFMMAFESLLYPALATIALGNGLFLPSLPSQINDLYSADDPRRGRAYNIYYVGLNIGGFMAPLICGTLGEIYGWHYGFAAAGIGMFGGLMIYLAGGRYLPVERERKTLPVATHSAGGRDLKIWLLLLGVGIAATVFRGHTNRSATPFPCGPIRAWIAMQVVGRFR
ncbi:peptide MFS transporter [Pseudolysobacter antarcticus]|uniref:peptide MFS transporter n=1 Tax=Pseudolysobacter antarcticus TaxID=2511995 RepID=UPI001F5E0F67|nr:oligopeptide:H+ symporter [Pseudolysobacter antarcticus]